MSYFLKFLIHCILNQSFFVTEVCELNQAEVGGICCPEGQVNDLGSCEDTCPPHRPINIKGVCGKCGLGEAAVGGICCPEGNVNDEGACQDSCPPIRPISVAGVCGE